MHTITRHPLRGFFALVIAFASAGFFAQTTGSKTDTQRIGQLIQTYATSIDRADTNLANQIWSNAPEVSFIHPRGEEHGRDQIEANVYRTLMGSTFSERKLSPKDVSVHVYGDTAWSEFTWDFVAKLRKDGSPVHTEGRETQVYRRENGQWKIIHIHYSAQTASQ